MARHMSRRTIWPWAVYYPFRDTSSFSAAEFE